MIEGIVGTRGGEGGCRATGKFISAERGFGCSIIEGWPTGPGWGCAAPSLCTAPRETKGRLLFRSAPTFVAWIRFEPEMVAVFLSFFFLVRSSLLPFFGIDRERERGIWFFPYISSSLAALTNRCVCNVA